MFIQCENMKMKISLKSLYGMVKWFGDLLVSVQKQARNNF